LVRTFESNQYLHGADTTTHQANELPKWNHPSATANHAPTDASSTFFGATMPNYETPANNSPYFEIMFVFHHCLGDGLSMYAFARTLCELLTTENFNTEDLKLENIPVIHEPPPLIDNLFNPNLFQVLPGEFSSI
jgi:hypothetical protein